MPKGPSYIWVEIVKNCHFLGQQEKMNKMVFFFLKKIQLYKFVLDFLGNVLKNFRNFDYMDWKIITFEVMR